MNNPIEKKLSELNRWEWALWQWHEVTEVGHDDRHFLRGHRRTVDEAILAAKSWDAWMDEAKE